MSSICCAFLIKKFPVFIQYGVAGVVVATTEWTAYHFFPNRIARVCVCAFVDLVVGVVFFYKHIFGLIFVCTKIVPIVLLQILVEHILFSFNGLPLMDLMNKWIVCGWNIFIDECVTCHRALGETEKMSCFGHLFSSPCNRYAIAVTQ